MSLMAMIYAHMTIVQLCIMVRSSSKNRQQTIEVLRPDLPCGNANSLGQKNGLSDGDIQAVIGCMATPIPL
jgi:hypothetical protein